MEKMIDESASRGQSEPQRRTTSVGAGLTYVLFLIFGVGSWLTVNGVFTELPFLVAELPEGWRLGSVLALAVQVANLGPLLYYGVRRRVLARDPAGATERLLANVSTYVVLWLGSAAMLLLSFFWHRTVAGSSLPLIVLTGVAALADCTSSLLFWRFASNFRPVFVSALAAGEGLSGAVSSALAWLQGASLKEPNFSADTYFLVLAVCMLVSCLAFHLLRSSAFAQRVGRNVRPCIELGCPLDIGQHVGIPEVHPVLEPTQSLAASTMWTSSHDEGEPLATERPPKGAEVTALLVLQAWLNFLQNGVSVSCLGLAAKPYGRETFQLASSLSLVVDPVAAALGYLLRTGAKTLLAIAVLLGVMFSYMVALSLKAVEPPLLHSGGAAVLVTIATVGRALTAYTKMRSNVLLQAVATSSQGQGALLMWSGACMQVGACVGSLTMYMLINWTRLFRDG